MKHWMDNESTTRRQRIDPRLATAGWSVQQFQRGYVEKLPNASAVEEWPTSAGPADYVLCDAGSILAVVEAKKLTIGAQGVLPQAERYSRAIESDTRYQGEFGVPFLYSTNGEEIWFHDVRMPLNRSRRVACFHTPTALRELLERDFDGELSVLRGIPMHEGIRPYQVDASIAIEQAIVNRHRKMLVTMATGTGKTLMTVHEIYRLMKSGVARRVLFLVDRRALAAQTVRAFASFEAELKEVWDRCMEIQDVLQNEIQPKLNILAFGHPDPDVRRAADVLGGRLQGVVFYYDVIHAKRKEGEHATTAIQLAHSGMKKLRKAAYHAPFRIERPEPEYDGIGIVEPLASQLTGIPRDEY
jgi:Type III restriction enzyme, res subunit/Type I restriction enzyme R protein N terminus (HSDR_N)